MTSTIRIQLTESCLLCLVHFWQAWQPSERGASVRSLLQALQHPSIHLIAAPVEVARVWAATVEEHAESLDGPIDLQDIYTAFARDFQSVGIQIPSLQRLEALRTLEDAPSDAPLWTWAVNHQIDGLIVHPVNLSQYQGSPLRILDPKRVHQEHRVTGIPMAELLIEQLIVREANALLNLILSEANDLSATFLVVLGVLIFDHLVWLFGLGMVDPQGASPAIPWSEAKAPEALPPRDDDPDPPPGGVRPVRPPIAPDGGVAIAIVSPPSPSDASSFYAYSDHPTGSGLHLPPPIGGEIAGRAIAGVVHHLYQFLVENIPRLSQEFSTGSTPVSPSSERTLVLVNFENPHVQVPAVVIGAGSGAIAVSETSVNAWANLPVNAPGWTLANAEVRASADSLALTSRQSFSIQPYANPSLSRLAGIARPPIAVAADLTSDEFARRLSSPAFRTLGQTLSVNPPGHDDPGRWLNADLAVVVRDIAGPALPPSVSTVGPQTIAIALGSGETVIDRFGGIGQGSNPLPSVIAEVDTLQFSGAGMTAQNLLLTQRGDDLVIAFAGVANTTVVLRNFDLDHLDNLARSSGDTFNLGNILFDGDAAIADDFDVINAGDNAIRRVLKRNTTTFLNDLDNEVSGFDDSDDTINGQGGNDLLFGLGGNDRLRGGAGNDQLVGGAGVNILTGDAGADTFVIALDGRSQVTDFNPTEDRIGLPNGLRQDQLRIESGSGINAGSTRIWVNGFWVMELTGVNPRALTTQNFVAVAYGSGPLPTITSA